MLDRIRLAYRQGKTDFRAVARLTTTAGGRLHAAEILDALDTYLRRGGSAGELLQLALQRTPGEPLIPVADDAFRNTSKLTMSGAGQRGHLDAWLDAGCQDHAARHLDEILQQINQHHEGAGWRRTGAPEVVATISDDTDPRGGRIKVRATVAEIPPPLDDDRPWGGGWLR